MALDAVEDFPGPDAGLPEPIMMAMAAADWEPREIIELVYTIMILNPFHYGSVVATLFAFDVGASGACAGAGRGYKVCAKFFDKQATMMDKAVKHFMTPKGQKAIEKYDDLLADEIEDDLEGAVERGTAEVTSEAGLWGQLFG